MCDIAGVSISRWESVSLSIQDGFIGNLMLLVRVKIGSTFPGSNMNMYQNFKSKHPLIQGKFNPKNLIIGNNGKTARFFIMSWFMRVKIGNNNSYSTQ